MKQFLLIILFLLIQITGFSQEIVGSSPGWGNNLTIDDSNISSEVKIYPNPCREEFVTIEFNNKEIKEIKLTSITGKEIFLKTYQFFENKKQIQLNDIPSGIYIIKIKTSDGKLVMKKLMVSKK